MHQEERRKNPRVSVCDPIAFLSVNAQGRSSHHNVAMVRDVCQTGIRIETFQPIASEDIILMFFDLNQKQMEVRGSVIYCVKNDCGLFNVGINLCGTDFENRHFVKALVKSYHYQKNKTQFSEPPGIQN
ncbi:MAG: PilZ domain-containing protein [Desulfobacterales bacterium]|nr:PilZ domain-containing protein [Desulfobacterales bacterium]